MRSHNRPPFGAHTLGGGLRACPDCGHPGGNGEECLPPRNDGIADYEQARRSGDPEFSGQALTDLVLSIEMQVSRFAAGATPLGCAVIDACETALARDRSITEEARQR